MWYVEPRTEANEHARVLSVRVGPYFLAVIEEWDGRVTWSVGEGDTGALDELEGVAPDVPTAKLAAVGEARRRWHDAGTELGELEHESGARPTNNGSATS